MQANNGSAIVVQSMRAGALAHLQRPEAGSIFIK
jgi:hypothetical protein